MEYIVAGKRLDSLEKDVKSLLNQIRINEIVKPDDTVVIKPNMGNLTYSEGVVTTPELVFHVVSAIRDRASEVIVGESDGIRYSCDEAFEKTGIKQAAEQAGGRVINFSKDKQVEIQVNGLFLDTIKLAESLVNADVRVSIPVIKTHEATTITCAMKNQFGCIPDRRRILYHHHLNEVLVDINRILDPRIIITDGIACMEGNGPIHGPIRHENLLFASNHVVANDLVIAEHVMQIPVERIKHLKIAIDNGFGPSSLDEIKLLADINEIKSKFSAPQLDIVAKVMLSTFKSRTLTWLLYVSPFFNFLNEIAWLYRGIRGVERRKMD
ncbi:MAG: DUF362 domain-containing protein [Candidatus Ranarchaeia archaeon]